MEIQFFYYQSMSFWGRLFAISLFVFILSFSDIIVANTGSDWLSTQITPEEGYANNLDIATEFQSTAETIQTLYALEVITTADMQDSSAYLHMDTVNNTENLSRVILSNTLAGLETTSLMTDLLKHSNADGGFSDFAGYESTTLDTAFALQALATGGYSSLQTVTNAISYLLNKQNLDGGYSLSDGNESNVYVTSLCLSALQQYIFQYNLSETVSSAIEYLFSRQLASGGWGTDWETALVLTAVAPITTDVTRYVDAVSSLKNAQNTDGSWGGSVYTTALALHVLHNIQNIKLPVDVNNGVLTGDVVNAVSGLSLQNVTVTIQGAESFVINTEVDGRFLASNLPAPQSYIITYSAAGYQEATQNISIVKGQHIYLGVIQLNPLPDSGFLTGFITDAETGQAVNGVTIKVSNAAGNIIATSGADGSYFITVNPGAISINVTAAGYAGVTSSGSITLGGTLRFSPALYSEGSVNPGAVIILRGTVIDADTLTPLQGVKVSVAGSLVNEVLTEATGGFVLTDITAGEIQLDFQLTDYQSTRLNMLVSSSGDFDLGNIQLRQLTGLETLISGTVTDNMTGDVIVGAVVQAMEHTTTSDINGNFQLNNITDLDFSVSVSAVGYLTFETQLALHEPGPVQINIPMQAAVRGVLEIVSVLADQSNYDAYNLVTINSLVQNTGEFSQNILLLGEVSDPSGQVIHRFPLSVAHNEAELGESVTVATSESVEFEGVWSTEANSAGNYQLKIKLFDANNSQLLSEKATSISIDETHKIRLLQIKATPGYTNLNETEQIELSVIFVNLSNTLVETDYDYSIFDPDGKVIKSGELSLQITPAEQQKSFVIDSFLHTFDKSGIYNIELQYQAGAVAKQILSSSISVAPNIRVELKQNILPSNVIPDGDKRIRIGVEIKGVQQQ